MSKVELLKEMIENIYKQFQNEKVEKFVISIKKANLVPVFEMTLSVENEKDK